MSKISFNFNENLSKPICLDQILPDIKRILLSKNIDFKIKALNLINTILQEPTKILFNHLHKPIEDIFIEEDIIEFLSDALSSLNLILLESIFKCLELLLISNKFFNHQYLIIVNECLLRSLHFLIKKKENNILNKGLELLIKIFQGMVSRDITILSACCHLDQLLSVLAGILEIQEKHPSKDHIINISIILFGILEQQERLIKGEKWELNASEVRYFIFISQTCLSQMGIFCEGSSENALQFVAISCKLSIFIYRLTKWILIENQNYFLKEMIKKLKDQIFLHIEKTCGQKILALHLNFMILEFVEDWYNCIIELLKDEDENKVTQMAISLIGNGFLAQTCKAIKISTKKMHEKKNNPIETVIRHCLGQMLASLLLAETYKMIPREHKELEQRIVQGVLGWPINASEALSFPPGPSSDAYLVFLYFSILCHQRPSEWGCHLTGLSILIQCSDLQRYPLVLLKCLWLDFAVAWLSQNESIQINTIMPAHGILVSALDLAAAWPGLRAVFTRHPALVFWSCSPLSIPAKLRTQIVCLWLEEYTMHGEVLMENLVLASSEAEVCLIDIVTRGDEPKSAAAARILARATETQQRNGQTDLVDTLWQLLPTILAAFSSENPEIKVTNIVSLLDACSAAIPSQSSSYIRSASWLAQLIVEPRPRDTAFYRAALRHLYILLLMSINTNDHAILTTLVCNHRFLLIITSYAETSENPEICSLAIRLLAYLLYFQRNSNVSCNDNISINMERLLELLDEGDSGVQAAVLQLIYVLLESTDIGQDFKKAVINFNRANEIDFIAHLRILYLKLQHLCVKQVPEIADHGWQCLRALLSLSNRQPEMMLLFHLATHPWTFTLLRLTLPKIKDPQKNSIPEQSISKGFLSFLSQWIRSYALTWDHFCNKDENFIREDRGVGLIKQIIKSLIQITNLDDNFRPMLLSVFDQVLTTNFNLPEPLVNDIQKHMELLKSQTKI